MEYMSVKEAAEIFDLSERRVQKLCETNRIAGSHMVSGVWLIPINAQKPVDERFSDIPKDDDVSLKQLCDSLSISTATGRNWIKLGKLIPKYTEKKTPYFTKAYVQTLKSEIQSGKNKALKSRRNKKFVSGNSLYNSYLSKQGDSSDILKDLLEIINQEKINFKSNMIQYVIADCALHLLAQKYNVSYQYDTSLLSKYLKGEITMDKYGDLIDALIDDPKNAIDFCETYPHLFTLKYMFERNEDILGLLYISCKSVGNRKATGSYFTPTNIVKKLISTLNITSHDKILDPCCGTGNFLLQLPDTIPFDMIYGNDNDDVSVKITRLNMALKYDHLTSEEIIQHISGENFLTDYHVKDFKYIIGNPPWGYTFTDDEKMALRKQYKVATSKNIESYDVFIECSLHHLSQNGELAYILPEAILNVKAHTAIREIILQTNSIRSLEYLGNVFDGVQCPCIILHLIHTRKPLSTVGMTIHFNDKAFQINTSRKVTSKYFSFLTSDQEYQLLQKIKHMDKVSFLANHADFALGIVTGNNKKYISSKKTTSNEIVLKGSDICKYYINPSSNYIDFKPESFQQTAPISMYRAPEKLLYRFICHQLVFAYDNQQTLSLNSCNILIPKLKEAKTKYVLAILNSRVAQFIYKMEFNSFKVLRSHIETIPIPIVDEHIQDTIIELTDALIQGMSLEQTETTYEELDQLIFNIFQLTQEERDIIKKAVDKENKFLF